MTATEKLKKSIELHARLYSKGKPLISDTEYDELVRQYNELTGSGDGPVAPSVVGSPVESGSPKVAHPVKMLSLNNAFDEHDRSESWHSIIRTVPNAEGYADLKIDGMAVRLIYQDGEFVGAATRGNGTIGENIFANAVRLLDVPKHLEGDVNGRISVVGEAYMRNSHFTLLNNDREQAGEDMYASPRNVVAGGMRNSDPDEVTKRGIRFFAYGLLHSDRPREFTYHSEVMEWLRQLGFMVVEHSVTGIRSESDVQDAFDKLSALTGDADYDCDGVVVKLDNLSARETLGEGRTAPNWAYACKFPAKGERTVFERIAFQVGRTGAITPVAEVKPVVIGDVTVSRVTLHNKDIVDELDLRVGDTVLVKRAGDVIPAIEFVYTDERDGTEQPVEFPRHCPVCGSSLVRPEGEARIYCPNSLLCPGQLQRGIEHFVGQDYMALHGVGPAMIAGLIGKGVLSSVSDLYRLTYGDVSGIAGMGDAKISNLLQEIEMSKLRPAHRLLASLGIHEVGRSASEILMAHFGSLRALLDATAMDAAATDVENEAKRNKVYSEIRALDKFGPKMTESLLAYLDNPNNREQLEAFVEFGVGADVPTESEAAASVEEVDGGSAVLPLTGMNVCATGKLEGYTRSTINSTIKANGGTAQKSVTQATHLLVAGERAGSKLAKARSLGVRVVSEWEFNRILTGVEAN